MQDAVITVNGINYRRIGDNKPQRVVLVVDRGWIFAGDLSLDEERGMLHLDRAVWVFRWEGVGFDGVLRDPKNAKVQLRKLDHAVEVPAGAEIFRVPVDKEWGL